MAEFFQFLASGLTVGAVYALVALGFTLIYNASDVVNFAQGEFVMLGGMVTVFVTAAGVPCELVVVPGMYHGADVLRAKVPAIVAFKDSWVTALRVAVGAR